MSAGPVISPIPTCVSASAIPPGSGSVTISTGSTGGSGRSTPATGNATGASIVTGGIRPFRAGRVISTRRIAIRGSRSRMRRVRRPTGPTRRVRISSGPRLSPTVPGDRTIRGATHPIARPATANSLPCRTADPTIRRWLYLKRAPSRCHRRGRLSRSPCRAASPCLNPTTGPRATAIIAAVNRGTTTRIPRGPPPPRPAGSPFTLSSMAS